MGEEKRFLVAVGLRNLPFPIRAISKVSSTGQQTIANISITARIMSEFETHCIDTLIRILHTHRDELTAGNLQAIILDYLRELRAERVEIDFEYPFFVEKRTPVSREKCLVKYTCYHSVKAPSIESATKTTFAIEIPAITTYPAPHMEKTWGLFGQLSKARIELITKTEVYPEDLVEIVDRHALVPVYSYLTDEDQLFLMRKAHTEQKTSVVMTNEIRDDLALKREIEWYSVVCFNYGMIHSYSTLVGTEKNTWGPFSGYEGTDL
jgi:GTP cyclohydrolase I